MISDFKPYPAYKGSAIPWLGDMPEHWEIRRGKNLFKCIDMRSSTGEEELLTVSSEHGIVPRRSTAVTMFKAESYIGYKLCWPKDLVINSLWAWARGLGVSKYHGIVSSAYGVYRLLPRFEDYQGYIHKLVRSNPFQWELQVRSKGIWISRLQLTDEAFFDAPFPMPPHDEIAVIVRFLDHMDRRIRRYIHAKQKLIKLLEEQKQAIIHHAVTRGLDPNVPLKPSGVEWLGDVPEHWKVVPVKQCAEVISKGTTPSTEGYEILDSGPVRFLKAENISGGTISNKPLCFIDERTNLALRRSQLRECDVLFVIAGATLGKTAIVNNALLPANTNQAVAFIRPNKRVISEYLALWLQSPRVKELTWLNAVQSAQPNLSMADLGNFVLSLPPTVEQKDVLCWLESILRGANTMIENTYRGILLLNEYRARLISDVVTGKLDVRGIDLPAANDAEAPVQFSDLLDSEAVMEDQELQEEIPVEND